MTGEDLNIYNVRRSIHDAPVGGWYDFLWTAHLRGTWSNASLATLRKRAKYKNRKGRRAIRRLTFTLHLSPKGFHKNQCDCLSCRFFIRGIV